MKRDETCRTGREERAALLPILERLEARIAPATWSINSPTVEFTDVDGDAATVSFNHPILESQEIFDTVFKFEASGDGEQLVGIDLTGLDLGVRNLDIRITAEQADGGDGTADIGFIHAAGTDLRHVEVDGNLGWITSGDDKAKTAGLRSLDVGSLGFADDATGPVDEVSSVVVGSIKKLNVEGDVNGALLLVDGHPRAGIGKVTIGGDIVGGEDDLSGAIYAAGVIGKVEIAESLIGGDGDRSGAILSDTRIAKITVGGDLVGGGGDFSGAILSDGRIKLAKVEGSLIGGDGERSGMIASDKAIGRIFVTEGIEGGEGFASGRIESAGKLGKMHIGGDIEGGGGEFSGSVFVGKMLRNGTVDGDVTGGDAEGSGLIYSDHNLRRLTVHGDLDGGGGELSGSVEVVNRIAKITIGGDLIGGDGDKSGTVSSFDAVIRRIAHHGETLPGDGAGSGEFHAFVNKGSDSKGGTSGGTLDLGGGGTLSPGNGGGSLVLSGGDLYSGLNFQLVDFELVGSFDDLVNGGFVLLHNPNGGDFQFPGGFGNSPWADILQNVESSGGLSVQLIDDGDTWLIPDGESVTLLEGFGLPDGKAIEVEEGGTLTDWNETVYAPGRYTHEDFPA